MLKVEFYDNIDDSYLKFAVIISKHHGRWVFCKHKDRDTFECPGGHREKGEQIVDTAARELWEETGAIEYDIKPVCVYSVENEGTKSHGMLYYADITKFDSLPNLEIEKIELFDELPDNWTYPLIQPLLLKKIEEII